MTLEIAQTAELSFAEATDLPVEISLCVEDKLLLMDFRVCSATIALLFVRMLDICIFLFRGALRQVGFSPL
ncbi:hypothetical protein [Pseudosulfitobacter sp. SM2401]|jgi:flagellar hook protein FlgE|uniref:hypothetical protein n=1 Tax=Pseudosulfitobacter sp. SM2401 TaxID=3350098 RepID=UPI002A2A6542|nr:hypothetical protein [Ascidiaceihabitans sp.]